MAPTTTPDAATLPELFLVEGVSAASTVRQAMDARKQSVFALQGKVLNADKASRSRVEANPVCASLFDTLGCGVADDCDPSKLRWSRVVLLTDPDEDGAHGRVLLARLFARFLEPLIRADRVLAVIPPRWRLNTSASGSTYAYAEEELRHVRREAQRSVDAGSSDVTVDIMHFRGVAQFSPTECVELLLDPATRRQVRLTAT